MTRLQSYYDRTARNHSLNWAIALTIMAGSYCTIGVLQFLKYFQHHDSFYLFAGPIGILLGAVGIFQGVQVTHAVVRRLVAEASTATH
jgi:hypothetical protein